MDWVIQLVHVCITVLYKMLPLGSFDSAGLMKRTANLDSSLGATTDPCLTWIVDTLHKWSTTILFQNLLMTLRRINHFLETINPTHWPPVECGYVHRHVTNRLTLTHVYAGQPIHCFAFAAWLSFSEILSNLWFKTKTFHSLHVSINTEDL